MNTNKLNFLVESSNLNKKQIADRCKISCQALYNILSGGDTRVSTLESLLDALGATMVDLYGGEPSQTAIASGENSIAAVNSKVGKDALEEKVRLLEKLLEEKERTIQILMGR